MSGKKVVLDLGSDSEEESLEPKSQLTINKDYAERYDRWRGSEELQKLKDRYGDVEANEDSSSSSSSEEEWTAEKEKAFFKTFSLLKKKDPKIYDSNVRFFEGEQKPSEEQPVVKKPKKEKTYRLKDHERKMILEKGGLSDGEDETRVEPSYVQEQENIKKHFSDALQQIDSDAEGDDLLQSDLLKKRKKTEAEVQDEEEEYRKWLRGEVGKVKDGGDDLKFLRDYWTDPNLNEDEKFLRDYILNRKYREPEDRDYVPTYDEIVHDSDEEGLSGDEANVNKMEEFEHKYNFRFEEPDQEFIKRYPRTVESSLRRSDDKRKRQREAAKERKEAEKAKKREEIQRLKALKRKEILEKLKQLESITGDPTVATKFEDDDIEGDFDPDEHDRRMQKIFNEEYYGDGEEEKPVFPYDEELDEEWKAYCPEEESEGDEDEPSTMSANKDASTPRQETEEVNSKSSSRKGIVDELIEASKGKKQRKKKSVFVEAIERAKPKFDPSTYESFEQYFDEYYKLDFEDLIGDLPCRFKYRKVTPNNFGLSVDEILKAPDKELNQWASLKKTYQYRHPEEEKFDLQAYEKKASNIKQKQKLIPTLFKTEEEIPENDNQPAASSEQGTATDKKKKRKKKKKKKSVSQNGNSFVEMETNEMAKEGKSKTKRKLEDASETVVVPEPVEDPEQGPKKKKVKTSSVISLSNGSDSAVEAVLESEVLNNGSNDENTEKKNKKRKKRKQAESSEVSSSEPSFSVSVKPEEANGQEPSGEKSQPSKKKKSKNSGKELVGNVRHKARRGHKDGSILPRVDDDRLRAYGINPTKFKKQLKYGKKK